MLCEYPVEIMIASFPLIALAAQLVNPVNDQVPVFDVAVSCRAAATAGLVEAESYQSCMNDERSARDELSLGWASFASNDRGRCATEASGDGLPSYVELLVCLQMSRDAREMQTPLKGARKK